MTAPTQHSAQNLTPGDRSRGGQNSPANFKNDPTRAAELGRKGGENSRGGGRKEEEEDGRGPRERDT